jgi:hypothetical protein
MRRREDLVEHVLVMLRRRGGEVLYNRAGVQGNSCDSCFHVCSKAIESI